MEVNAQFDIPLAVPRSWSLRMCPHSLLQEPFFCDYEGCFECVVG